MKLNPGMVLAVNHEPLSFLRRSGHAAADEESRFLQDHSEENIIKLAQNRCDIVRFHFYKGFGLKAEKEEMEMTREYVGLCHKHGIKVQLYIQFGTLYPETLLAEQPLMMDWVQRDGEGRPITLVYGHQNCRLYPCFNKPGYWDYLEGIIHKGIVDIGGDAIGFDNITTSEEPVVCQCDSCRKAFVEFLNAKYKPDTAEGAKLTKQRFGHAILDYIQPPHWNYFNHAYNMASIDNPVAQEWVLFRCESLGRAMKRVYDFSKGLNPDILLEYNVYKQFGTNTAFIHGVYLPDYTGCLDAFWNECDAPAEFTENGELHSRIRAYKMARAMGRACFTNHPFGDELPNETVENRKAISYAESMAFNRGLISGVDRAYGIYSGKQQTVKPFQRFALEHAEIYRGKSAATVALYESKASLSFSNYAAWYADMTMQQCLIRGHIPFDLIFSLDAIGKYQAVVLPGTECLSFKEIECLCRFARCGGTLVLTDNSGAFDNWRRAWGDSSLVAMLGIGAATGNNIVEVSYGNGKVVYVPELKSDIVFDPGKLVFTAFGTNQPVLGPEYLRTPVNSQEIIKAIWRACGPAIPVEVDAPEYVAVEVQTNECGSAWYLHLINYKPTSDAAGIRVRLNAPTSGGYKNAAVLSPDGTAYCVQSDSNGWLALKDIKCYSVICFGASSDCQ